MTTREERAKARALKRKKQKLVTFFVIFLLIMVGVLIALGVIMNRFTPDKIEQSESTTAQTVGDAEKYYNAFLGSSMVLRDYIFDQDGLEAAVKKELGDAYNTSITVFLSVSDGSSAAHVVNGTGSTLSDAWNIAEEKMGDVVKENLLTSVYIKADIVNKTERIKASDLPARIDAEAGIYGEFFRRGIAFDGGFSAALLEAELNSRELIDYDITKNLFLDKVNLYLQSKGISQLASIPENLYLFSCRGYVKDTDGCYTLSYDTDSTYGRRTVKTADYACITQSAASVAVYMLNNMTSDGKFTYGYYPTIGLPIDRYDIGYHAMALSALLQYSDKLDSAGLYESKIENATKYLASQIVYKDENTAYAADASSGEITAGGNVQAIIALCNYQNVTGYSSYLETAKKLGNGLLAMIDSASGKPAHVLYYKSADGADFAVKSAQSDRSYDSSSIYALCKLYALTEDGAYLLAASSIADALVRENDTQYADCWITEAMEELTKYNKKPEYYDFALKNFNDNINALENRVISMPQYTRLLVGTYNVYAAMQADKVTTELYNSFDHDKLVSVTVKRAADLLNGLAYPEISMYFRDPGACLNAFFIRQDGFRIRIDDMASFITAYMNYAEKYTLISTDAFNVAAQQTAAAKTEG